MISNTIKYLRERTGRTKTRGSTLNTKLKLFILSRNMAEEHGLKTWKQWLGARKITPITHGLYSDYVLFEITKGIVWED